MLKQSNNTNKPLRLALDGNEANIKQRVGSNVYAFEILKELYKLTKNDQNYHCTVLLARKPIDDLPKERTNWRYEVVGPRRLWTQWALPLHLFWHQHSYDIYYTASHYAPRLSSIPYVNTIHDLAFLEYPQQFNKNDLFQLKNWTPYSVHRAAKVIAVSKFTKQQVHQTYQKNLEDIIIASPAVVLPKKYSPLRFSAFCRKQSIRQDQYFLYLGTLQPRKNIAKLIEAFEIFSRFQAASKLKKKDHGSGGAELPPPQLVIAGKIGWLAGEIQERVEQSPVKAQIIMTGFVAEEMKKPLYEHALATVALGDHEGFGIPPLESLSVGTPAIVADSGSLPDTVGSAGQVVDSNDPHQIADTLKEVYELAPSQRERLAQKAKKQANSFSWQKSAQTVLKTLKEITNHG
jgi:glycosyltransferase involved in cell wall biosynthesis